MSLKTPLAAAAVGALLIGGAATGTTLALWRDQATLSAGAVHAGDIKLHVDGATAATFASVDGLPLNAGATEGEARSFTATLTNAGQGKNLRMKVVLDDVTTDNTGLDNGLEISVVGTTPGTACPAPVYQPLNAINTVVLTDSSLAPGGTRTMCVSLRVKADAGVAVQKTSGSLSFSFHGEQVRP